MGERIGGVENRITSVENRIVSLEATINSRFNILENSMNTWFSTLTLVVFGNVTATILAAVGVVVAVLQAG
jgi:hypothetical protein